MNKLPERYKEIRNFIGGLHTQNKLLGSDSTIAFLKHDDYWSSHVVLSENEKTTIFSVRYMKDRDEVWVVSNFYNQNIEYDSWLKNTLGYDLKQQNIHFEVESRRPSYYGHNFYVKAKLEKDKDYMAVYDIYMLFNQYREKPGEKAYV